MPYTNNTTNGAFAQERDTAALINQLDNQIQSEIDTHQVHQDLIATFSKADPVTRQKLIRAEIQNFGTAATMLRAFGLTLEDIARLITTA